MRRGIQNGGGTIIAAWIGLFLSRHLSYEFEGERFKHIAVTPEFLPKTERQTWVLKT